jgi:hypothetical protein
LKGTYLDEIPIIQVGYSNFNAQPIRVLWVLWIQAGWFSTGFHKKLKIGKWVINKLIDNQVIFQYLAYN